MGLLNVDGYYNYLLSFIDKAVDDGFIKPSQRHIIVSAPNATELVQKLEAWVFNKNLNFLFFIFRINIILLYVTSKYFDVFSSRGVVLISLFCLIRNTCRCMMGWLLRLSGRRSKWSLILLCRQILLVD